MPKYIVLLSIFFLTACVYKVVDQQPAKLPQGKGLLVVEVMGLRNDRGEIFLSLFSGPKGFPDDPKVAVVNRHESIANRSCRIKINDLPYGNYAISLLHDENRDGKMNSNLLGAPKEGFGFSGNPKTKLGPPGYEDVHFLLLVPEKTLQVSVQYETVGRERQRIMQERQRK